jgi:hypothetical protein
MLKVERQTLKFQQGTPPFSSHPPDSVIAPSKETSRLNASSTCCIKEEKSAAVADLWSTTVEPFTGATD